MCRRISDISHRRRNELPLIRNDRFPERRADQGARRDVAVDLRVADAELGEHLAVVLALKSGLGSPSGSSLSSEKRHGRPGRR